ncbi:hypothetical protein [Tomitella fengzijianii]|uniref:Uncharacterized protein n=1 Tax=Tomitella fengzijianii TaxID=2597660 RepID=A0A516X7K3_9ACTN|nr:hypothetical protein [Tomitella fengzijianii]QDQ98661.1 hypothetical protein FO059_16695 [Tomitella fengzijianii]
MMNAQEAAIGRQEAAAGLRNVAFSRALAVTRMNSRQWMLFAMPWAIVLVVTWAHAAILAIVRSQGVEIPDEGFNGVGSTLFFFSVAMFASITTQHFPFAMGLGVTRRDFYLGTALTSLCTGVVNGVLVLIFAQIERATDGYTVHLEVLSVVYRITDSPALVFFSMVLVTMAFAALGVFAGVVYLKWRANGMFTAALILALVAAVAALLITWQRGWPAVGRFFVDTPVAVLLLAVPAVLGVLLFGAGYRMMRNVEA